MTHRALNSFPDPRPPRRLKFGVRVIVGTSLALVSIGGVAAAFDQSSGSGGESSAAQASTTSTTAQIELVSLVPGVESFIPELDLPAPAAPLLELTVGDTNVLALDDDQQGAFVGRNGAVTGAVVSAKQDTDGFWIGTASDEFYVDFGDLDSSSVAVGDRVSVQGIVRGTAENAAPLSLSADALARFRHRTVYLYATTVEIEAN